MRHRGSIRRRHAVTPVATTASVEGALLAAHGLDRVRSLNEAIAVVERLRGRPIEVHEERLGDGVWAMWLGHALCDRIIVNADMAVGHRHREHIVSHELIHILNAHIDPGAPQGCALRTNYDDPHEHLVESIASYLVMAIRAAGLPGRLQSMIGTRAGVLRDGE